MGSKPSKEQRIEAQGGASKQGANGQKVKITGGNTGSGRYDVDIGSDPLLGKEYVVNDDVISMNNGNERYRWNEHSQRYNAVPGYGHGYLLVDSVAAPAQEGSSGGGGGGGGKRKPNPRPGHAPPVTITDEYDTIIPGTGGLLASEGMDNWNPISSNGNGGAGLNPLVDPQEWLVELPELNMGQQSRKWIPKKQFYGGLV